jgi:hypothetical protein
MSLSLKPGTRVYSAVDAVELMVVKAPATPVALTIGGLPAALSAVAKADSGPLPDHDGGVAVGKRYVDSEGALEVLCVKPGAGVPAIDGVLLTNKSAKPLPSSD